MADISMCMGLGCEKKSTCYRYTATPNEYRQSYFMNVPVKVADGKQVCEHYWNDKGYLL